MGDQGCPSERNVRSAFDPERTLVTRPLFNGTHGPDKRSMEGENMEKYKIKAALVCAAALLICGCTHHTDDPAVRRALDQGSAEVLFHFDRTPPARIDDVFVVQEGNSQIILCGHVTGAIRGVATRSAPFIFMNQSGSLIATEAGIEAVAGGWKAACGKLRVVEGRRRGI